MKTHATLLLTFLLILTSCQPASPPPLTETAAPTEEPISTPEPPTATPLPTVSPTPSSNRSAAFTEVENVVESRPSESAAYAPAAVGLKFPVGGQARTGDDGRARVDLAPDGTIVRIAPNTIFTLTELQEDEEGPFTWLELLLGQIYIILSGGELHVKTPSGVAAVRGSMMGVYYDPQTGTMTATCLEGHCSLENDKGRIELVAGQAADIRDGVLSREPRPLTDFELQDWLDFTPELKNRPDMLHDLRDRIENLPPLPRPRPRPRP